MVLIAVIKTVTHFTLILINKKFTKKLFVHTYSVITKEKHNKVFSHIRKDRKCDRILFYSPVNLRGL